MESSENVKTKNLHFHQIFRYATSKDKYLLIAGIISALIGGQGLALTIILFGKLANSFIYFTIDAKNSKGNVDQFMAAVRTFAFGSILIGCGQLLFCYLMMICISKSARSQAFRVKTLYLKSVLRQEISWFDTYSRDFSTEAGESLIKYEDGIGQKLAVFIYLVTECISNIIVALIYGWKLTLIILSMAPVLICCTFIFSKAQSYFAKKELIAYSKAAILAEETFSAVKTIAAFGGEDKIVEWYKAYLSSARNSGINRGFANALSSGIGWMIDYSGYCLAFLFGVRLIIESEKTGDTEYDPGILVIVLFCAMMGSMCLSQSSPYLNAINIARISVGPIFEVIERKSAIDCFSLDGLIPGQMIGTVEFRNVHFSYPARPEISILNGINLKFNRGEKVALVGSSGCGKSTILQLIQRFYDPTAGQVLIDDRDIRQYNIRWLRQNISIVRQEPVLFALTIEENIQIAGEGMSKTEIIHAAKAANAHEFIMKLPHNYRSEIGERGANLSGGQKQRIAIARALIRQPRILMMDEATSNLDGQAETMVQNAVDQSAQDRTTIIVAHRLSTVRNSDRIVVLDQGRVMEMGTHDELMAQQSFYYNLVQSQIVADLEDIDIDPGYEMLKMSDMFLQQRLKKLSFLENEKTELLTAMPSIVRILKFSRSEWWQIMLGCIGSLGFGISIPLYALLFGKIMGILSETDNKKAADEATYYSLFFLGIGAIAGLSSFLQIFMFTIVGEYLTMRLRIMTLATILQQEMAWFAYPSNNVGSLCMKLSTDASNVQGVAGTNIGFLLQAFGAIVISTIIALILVWQQAILSAMMIPFICSATYLEARFITGELFAQMEVQENLSKIAVEAIVNIRTLASLGKEELFYLKYEKLLHSYYRSTNSQAHYRGFLYGLSQAIISWAYGISLWYGGWLIKEANVHYADVFKVGELIIFGAMMVGESVAFAPNYNKGLISAARIFAILDRKPRITDPHFEAAEPKGSQIEFQHVKFSYPLRPYRVFRNFSCMIEEGKTIALVGRSGCGKSTCIQLIERFYDPLDGAVLFAGTNIKDLNVKWLRAQLGLVSQEPILFDRTIAENIAFGDNTREVTNVEILAAARKANIHNFITSLPEGYNTPLGRKGAGLSVGQKQRIAIARALVRNPRVLLLDEATSALDTRNEKLVQAALEEAMVGRTCIMIAHRLVTVQAAHKIFVIDHGNVIEEGTHEELMRKRGVYYQMNLLSRR